MGWLWLRLGKADWLRLPHRPDLDGDVGKGAAFWAACRHDVMHAGGFLVVGAAAAATINVVVPEPWLQRLAGNPVLSVAGAGRAGGAAVHLLGGRRVRGRVADPVLAHRPAGVPGRRADGRPEAVRHAGRHVRARGSRCGSRRPRSSLAILASVLVGAVLL